MEIVEELLSLLEKHPEEIIIFSIEDCIYFNGKEFILSYSEGGDRIHDSATKITKEEACEIIKQWASKGLLKIAVVGLTPPYEQGVDWFT